MPRASTKTPILVAREISIQVKMNRTNGGNWYGTGGQDDDASASKSPISVYGCVCASGVRFVTSEKSAIARVIRVNLLFMCVLSKKISRREITLMACGYLKCGVASKSSSSLLICSYVCPQAL